MVRPGSIEIDSVPESRIVDLPVVNHGFADDEPLKGPLTALVDQLRSAAYSQREQASQRLLRLPPDRLPELVLALERESDAEAIARLMQVASHLFLKERTFLQRPSFLGVWFKDNIVSLMGVRFEPESIRLSPDDLTLARTVVVTDVVIGLPAYQVLHPGDRIVAVNGKRFELEMTKYDFQAEMRAFWPGAIFHLTILREGKPMELTMQMAGVPADAAGDVDQAVSDRAAALEKFVKNLKTGDSSPPLLMKPPTDLGLAPHPMLPSGRVILDAGIDK